VTDPFSEDPELIPLTRPQVLIAMGVTAIVLLVIGKLWVQFGQAPLLTLHWSIQEGLIGVALGICISLMSAIVYSVWAAYRRSADYYLHLVLKPLVLPDVIWLGLLPGLSEEFLFRGVMLPTFGMDGVGIVFSSLCFGVLHLSSLRQWPYVIWATLIGGVLGGSAVLTNNLLVPIVAHTVTNLISSFLWKSRDRAQNQISQ
jgi:uncharacterized protein